MLHPRQQVSFFHSSSFAPPRLLLFFNFSHYVQYFSLLFYFGGGSDIKKARHHTSRMRAACSLSCALNVLSTPQRQHQRQPRTHARRCRHFGAHGRRARGGGFAPLLVSKKNKKQPVVLIAAAAGEMASTLVGAIDQGTTSTRFILYRIVGDGQLATVASHQMEHQQIYPQPG